jgi:hypothetical protein
VHGVQGGGSSSQWKIEPQLYKNCNPYFFFKRTVINSIFCRKNKYFLEITPPLNLRDVNSHPKTFELKAINFFFSSGETNRPWRWAFLLP